MERANWDALEEIRTRERQSLADILSSLDARRGRTNLTAAIRLFIVSYFRDATDLQLGRLRGLAEDDLESDAPTAVGEVGEAAMRSGRIGKALDAIGPMTGGGAL